MERDFELASVTRELIEKFSKRTMIIEELAKTEYIVFRFRQNLALFQPRLNIFLDYLDALGIRRYPILVVAHTSHEERWTVTNERLILVGPRHEQGITVTWSSAHFRSLCQHFLHSSSRLHRLHPKVKRILPI